MTVFRKNPGFAGAIIRSGQVKDHLEAVAHEGAKIASSIAPDDPSTPASEDLEGSIVGEVILGPDGYRGRILARNYKGLFWEFGTSTNGPRPFLRPALERLGFRVRDSTGPE